MKEPHADVRAFHEAMGQPVSKFPCVIDYERRELRLGLHAEEYKELTDAMLANDLTAIADGVVDLIYVLIGTALEYGLPLPACWAEVHRTNMAKLDPVTNRPRLRADGKILKPEGWLPPRLAELIELAHDQALGLVASKAPSASSPSLTYPPPPHDHDAEEAFTAVVARELRDHTLNDYAELTRRERALVTGIFYALRETKP